MSDGIIGGVGLTHLKVYDQRLGPDGIHAGCAHIHALTDEAYFGVAGEGAIELHDIAKGFHTIVIKKGTYVQFSAGVLHRSVSTSGLEVVAVMGNGGLPERGDARIYFGPEVDADLAEFERLKGLAAQGLEGALARRDASARGYQNLIDLWNNDKQAYRAELQRFLDVHRAAIAGTSEKFQTAIEAGPVRSGKTALGRVDQLGQAGTVLATEISTTQVNEGEPVLGMCGLLRQVASLTEIN